jgi:hypothetical protein
MEAEKYRDASLHDTIDQDAFWDRTDNHWMAMDRQMLREVMGYRGSESGTEKLMGGYNIDDVSKIDHVIARNATANDFAYVNLMYKIQEKLWDLGAPMEERVTGVAPDKIEPRSVEYRLSDKTVHRLDGGYWQVKYDDDTVFDISRGGLFDQQYQRIITTPHKWVIPRTQFMAPLDLSGANRVSQLMTMIHDIAFREPVLSIARLLRARADPEHWRMTYARKLGAEKNALMDGWLEDLANSQNFNRMPTTWEAKGFRWVRQNVETAYTFLNPSIILKHVPTAAATSSLETGVRGLFKGAYDIGPTGLMQQMMELMSDRTVRGMAPDPNFVQAVRLVSSATPRGAATRIFIYNKSAFMRERSRQYPETLHAIYDNINTPEAWKRWLRAVRQGSAQIGRFPVALGDSIFADATWIRTYNEHMAETSDDNESVYMADRAVLRSHGGPFQMDKPAALNIKGNDLASEFWKSMTMFMQFWNRNFVGIAILLRDIGAKFAGREEPGAVWSSIAARIFVRVVLVAAWDEIVRDLLYPSKRDLFEIMIGAVLQTTFGWHTTARNIVQAAYGHEPTFGAMGMAARDVWHLYQDLERLGAKGELGRNWLMHLFTAISVAGGIGGPQLGRTAQGLYGLETGEEQPETAGEALRVLQMGRLPRGE